MNKNLMDKVINSHDKEEHQMGTWLYSGSGVQGYVTSNGEYLDLRPKGDKHENASM